MSKVRATRNGETRLISREVWDQMPDDHYGWVQAAEVPQEVKDLQDQIKSKEAEPQTDPIVFAEQKVSPVPVEVPVNPEGKTEELPNIPDPGEQLSDGLPTVKTEPKRGRNADSKK